MGLIHTQKGRVWNKETEFHLQPTLRTAKARIELTALYRGDIEHFSHLCQSFGMRALKKLALRACPQRPALSSLCFVYKAASVPQGQSPQHNTGVLQPSSPSSTSWLQRYPFKTTPKLLLLISGLVFGIYSMPTSFSRLSAQALSGEASLLHRVLTARNQFHPPVC